MLHIFLAWPVIIDMSSRFGCKCRLKTKHEEWPMTNVKWNLSSFVVFCNHVFPQQKIGMTNDTKQHLKKDK